MEINNPALGPSTAVSQLDPNDKWVYGVVCPVHEEFYGMKRLVYTGESVQNLDGRKANNVYEAHKNTPYLLYNRALIERGLRPEARYLPFSREPESLRFFEYPNLLNVAVAGGGRKPSVVWTPAHVDAVLSERPYAELVAEFGIEKHHWVRLRSRYRDVQRPECWFDLDELSWWSIEDLYHVF